MGKLGDTFSSSVSELSELSWLLFSVSDSSDGFSSLSLESLSSSLSPPETNKYIRLNLKNIDRETSSQVLTVTRERFGGQITNIQILPSHETDTTSYTVVKSKRKKRPQHRTFLTSLKNFLQHSSSQILTVTRARFGGHIINIITKS